ncbi:hypothetical protein V5O48_017832 [Marasmius crinis-equi]|uniref:Uncharacterized protein n=1 Tax=Marasmius crinis-equi TaxID=585013 RepID=A0ABR3EMU8_9AGAR
MAPRWHTGSGHSKKYYADDHEPFTIEKVITPNFKTAEQWAEEWKRYFQMVVVMLYIHCSLDIHFMNDVNALPLDDDDPDWSDEAIHDLPLPPGEEGLYHSHDGQAVYNNVLESLLQGKKRRKDGCTWRDRTERQTQAWARQHDALVDAYLVYKAHGVPVPQPNAEEWDMEVATFYPHPIANHSQNYGPRQFYTYPNTQSKNETLRYNGFIGGSPELPTIAFDLEVLDLYRQLHRVCPSLSIEAYSCALLHLHALPRRRHLEDQLRIAYDEYLAIQRDVEKQIKHALGWDSDEYQINNICSPCMYEVEGKASLSPCMLLAMDANFSLKMVDSDHKHGQARTDTQIFSDPRWLDDDEVDIFKDEVKTAQQRAKGKGKGKRKGKGKGKGKSNVQPPQATPSPLLPDPPSTSYHSDSDSDQSNAETANSDVSMESGSPPPQPDPGNPATSSGDGIAWLDELETDELAKCVDTCVQQWKAAAPEDQKRMFAFFAITGVFVAVCWHDHLVVMCDMRKSGEL